MSCCYGHDSAGEGKSFSDALMYKPQPSNNKIIMLGDSGAGKTSLLERYITGEFSLTPSATIGVAFVEVKLEHEGVEIDCNFWDTAGQERYSSLLPMYISGARVCILAFDLSSSDYLSSIGKWLNVLSGSFRTSEQVYIVLAATKCDLVTPERAKEITKLVEGVFKYNCYITSSLKGIAVEAPFRDFLTYISNN